MTPPVPSRRSPDGRAYNDLRNLAKRNGREPVEYFTLYALEGLLARLTTSTYSQNLVLKGGVLMAAFAARRPTRDIDLAASGFVNDVAEVERLVRTIVGQHMDDGLVFEAGSIMGEEIREDAAYAGVRVRVVARLASARIALHVDINFGDPIWPEPTEVELPLLLGGSLRLPGYPDHMVLAEKIVTAIERGDQNTRWRDFVDVVAIVQTRPIRLAGLSHALQIVATYRDVELEPLAPLLERMPELAQARWAAWRRKQRLSDATPERFGDLLEEYLAFTEPALNAMEQVGSWEPSGGYWRLSR